MSASVAHDRSGRVTSSDTIRNAILEALMDMDTYVSGETLCEVAGVTRAAVWKHIRGLETLGFQFDKRHGVGYRIVASPDLLLEPLVRRQLPDSVALGRRVIWKPQTVSTNQDASSLANQGMEHGTVVTALAQQGGRGRQGRPWSSPEGGLWQSIILRQPIPLSRAAELTLIASVAIRRVVQKHSGLPISIKWPNDLLCHGRKICGILAEIRSEGEYVQHAVLGIGLNTNVPQHAIAPSLQDRATSTFIESGRRVSHLELERDLLIELDALLSTLRDDGPGFDAVSDEWRQASATLGQRVRVSSGDALVEGVAIDLDSHGVLYVKTGTEVVRILSGDVLF